MLHGRARQGIAEGHFWAHESTFLGAYVAFSGPQTKNSRSQHGSIRCLTVQLSELCIRPLAACSKPMTCLAHRHRRRARIQTSGRSEWTCGELLLPYVQQRPSTSAAQRCNAAASSRGRRVCPYSARRAARCSTTRATYSSSTRGTRVLHTSLRAPGRPLRASFDRGVARCTCGTVVLHALIAMFFSFCRVNARGRS